MTEILNYMGTYGLDPGHFPLDGKIHRFKADPKDKKKSGWAIGYQNHTLNGGQLFHVVVFGSFRDGATHTYQSNITLGKEDRLAVKKQITDAKAREEKARQKVWEDVAGDTEEKWNNLSDNGTSEYLRRKQISEVKNLGVKFGQGQIYIPARDIDGKIWSWETIDEDGGKFFRKGGRLKGCFHIVGKLGQRIYFAEGLSTSASVSYATGCGVVCCFSSSHLPGVVKALRRIYPDREFIICGDEDHWAKNSKGEPCNVGRETATKVAKETFSATIFPKFKDLEGKPTDFNDLHVREGIEKVKEQILNIKPPDKMAIYALGFRENEYYFTSTANKTIVGLSSFSEDNFLKLMPLQYWENVFPGERKRVDWTEAKTELISQCHKKGIFNGGLVRGSGAWTDEGRIVINMGNYLVVDGARMGLGQIKSRFFYTLSDNLKEISVNPLSVEECKTLVDACVEFKWSRGSDSGLLLAGALVLSRICGALPIRPHVWITGGAQTGKTTLLEKLVNPILGENKLYTHSGTTEAGLRQSLGANAVPVLFDEFETNGNRSDDNIAACIELMRASWASSGASIFKGSVSGNANNYQARFSAIVSSIRTSLTTDADKGRFAVLELAPHGSDEKHWDGLSQLLLKIDEEFSDRLFARTVEKIPIILENFKVIKKAFARKGGARFGDQYGMLLAGFASLIHDEVISGEDAQMIIDTMDFSEEKVVAENADHDDALSHLLTSSIRFSGEKNGETELVGKLISQVLNFDPANSVEKNFQGEVVRDFRPLNEERKKTLQRIGIKVSSEFVAIASSNHAELAKLWRGTKWAENWSTPLARLDGAQKNKSVRFPEEKPRKCVKIPAGLFDA